MPKTKYHFNRKSLTFEKVTHSSWEIFKKILHFLGVSIAFSVVVLIIAYHFFKSPKEITLQREIEQYKIQLENINKRIELISAKLQEIQEKDNNIYRVIFETNPIPENIRKSGRGGIEKYAYLNEYDNSKLLIDINTKIDNIAHQLSIQNKSYDEILKLARNKDKMLASIPAIQPIKNKRLKQLVSGFGMRIHPIYKTLKMHTGVDFVCKTGTPVYATGDGVVMYVEKGTQGYGELIVINHGYGYKTLYAHLSRKIVRPGQKVKRGEIIGYTGNSGLSTGPHLHYEVRKNNVPVNPVNFFFNDLTPAEYEQIIEIASKVNQSMS